MIPSSRVEDAWLMCKPRASGDDPSEVPTVVVGISVNPARAGMIRARYRVLDTGDGKPRASGDDPALTATQAAPHA